MIGMRGKRLIPREKMGMRKITSWIAAGLLICGMTSCRQSEQPVQIINAQSKSEPFQIDGLSVPSDRAKYKGYMDSLKTKLSQVVKATSEVQLAGTGSSIQYFDLIMYSYISCQADWNVFCSGTTPLQAPPGWQVCKLLHGPEQKNGNAYFSVTPADWYNGDSEHPARFNRYDFYTYAHGSGSPFNKTGANINVPNVGLRLIPSSANNYDRYAVGCDMPNH
jgi:hypothetical protein